MIQKGKIINRTGICNRCDIACKLCRRIVVGTLTNRGRDRKGIGYIRIGFRNFDSGLFIQLKHIGIFLDHFQRALLCKGAVLIESQTISKRTEEHVAGVLDGTDNVQISVAAQLMAVDIVRFVDKSFPEQTVAVDGTGRSNYAFA